MNLSRKEICSFAVTSKAGILMKVVVSQEDVSLYDRKHTFTGKYLNLNNINGPRVARTERDRVFKLEDGTELYSR